MQKDTGEDVNLAEKSFSSDVGSTKGETARKVPTPAFSNVIEIQNLLLSHQEEIVLSIYGLSKNSLNCL